MNHYRQHGTWLYIDPDEQRIELIEEAIDLETLCELLRCDATDLVQLTGDYHAYIDGEGEWQERQTEWDFNGNPCWGPILIFRLNEEEERMDFCTETDLEQFEPVVHFYND